jgi:hypothetical protein
MCDKHCPKCGSDFSVSSRLSLLFSLEFWDIALALAAAVWLVGRFQGLSLDSISLFIFLAALPALLVIQRKEFCEDCDIEFISKSISAPGPQTSQAKK